MGIRTVSHGRIGGIRQSIRRTAAGREDADVCQDVPEEDVQQQNFCGTLIHGILFLEHLR